jgi:hypothetical protein
VSFLFGPDGSRLAFFADGKLKVIDAQGSRMESKPE